MSANLSQPLNFLRSQESENACLPVNQIPFTPFISWMQCANRYIVVQYVPSGMQGGASETGMCFPTGDLISEEPQARKKAHKFFCYFIQNEKYSHAFREQFVFLEGKISVKNDLYSVIQLPNNKWYPVRLEKDGLEILRSKEEKFVGQDQESAQRNSRQIAGRKTGLDIPKNMRPTCIFDQSFTKSLSEVASKFYMTYVRVQDSYIPTLFQGNIVTQMKMEGSGIYGQQRKVEQFAQEQAKHFGLKYHPFRQDSQDQRVQVYVVQYLKNQCVPYRVTEAKQVDKIEFLDQTQKLDSLENTKQAIKCVAQGDQSKRPYLIIFIQKSK